MNAAVSAGGHLARLMARGHVVAGQCMRVGAAPMAACPWTLTGHMSRTVCASSAAQADTDVEEGHRRRFPCIRLRGLPFDSHEADVEKFLGVDTVDCLLLRKGGRLTGEAVVLLPGPQQVEAALAKHKAYMGERYVEVMTERRMEYYRAVSAEYAARTARPTPVRTVSSGGTTMRTGSSEGTNVLKLRGLPWAATEEDICRWFNEDGTLDITPVQEDDVVVEQRGIAYVSFASNSDAAAAMAKHRQMLGSRYIEIFAA